MKRQRELLVGKRIRLIKGMAEKENANDDNMRIIQYAAMSIETLTKLKNVFNVRRWSGFLIRLQNAFRLWLKRIRWQRESTSMRRRWMLLLLVWMAEKY